MKKLRSLIITIVLAIVISATNAYAVSPPAKNSINFKLDGITCKWIYVAPYKSENKVVTDSGYDYISYVTIRPIAEAMGYKWVAVGKNVTLTKKGSIISFVGGTDSCSINGSRITFREKTVLKTQIYGSLDCIEKMLNVSFDWVPDTKTLKAYRIGSKAYYNAGKSYIALNFDSQRMKFVNQGVFDLNGTAMIPLNAVGPFLGYVTKTVGKDIILSKGVNSLSFRSGVNGAVSKNGVICIPAKTVSDTFKVPCDYFPEGKTVRMYTTPIEQVKIYTQLRDSGMYYVDSISDAYGVRLVPKGMTSKMLSINVDTINTQDMLLGITTDDPYPEVRKILKDIVRIQFPNNCEDIYNRCIKVMREETYKSTYCTSLKSTDWDYIDGTLFYVSKRVQDGSTFSFTIWNKGYVRPVNNEVDPFLKHSADLDYYIDKYSLNE